MISKKGDLSECGNYKGIMLLSVPGKVFNRTPLHRMKAPVDNLPRGQQAGLRKARTCADKMATLRVHNRAVTGVEQCSVHHLHRL